MDEKDRQLIGISAWNAKLMMVMQQALYMRTNNNVIPLAKYNSKVTKALELLEEYEHAKHGALLDRFAKQVNMLSAEIIKMQVTPFWKIWKTWNMGSRIKTAQIQRQAFIDSMALIIDCLPDDLKLVYSEAEQQGAQAGEQKGQPSTPQIQPSTDSEVK